MRASLPARRFPLTAVSTWPDAVTYWLKIKAVLSGAAFFVCALQVFDAHSETRRAWQMQMPGVQKIKMSKDGRPIIVDGAGGHHQLRLVDGKLVVDPVIVEKPEALPINALPDAEIATSKGGLKAWLSDPTDRYNHAVLGDHIEAGSLSVRYPDGTVRKLILHENEVFEDRYPRFYDIDKDGRDEILLVRSSFFGGAALVVIDPGSADSDGPKIIAEADEIGVSNRWLNPLGAADVDGDGQIELLVVIMPHLAGILGVYKRDGTKLVPQQGMRGFSNHGYGSYELDLSVLAEMDGDGITDAVLPDIRRRELRVVRFAGGTLEVIARYQTDAPIEHRILVFDLDGDGKLEVITATHKDTIVVWKPAL